MDELNEARLDDGWSTVKTAINDTVESTVAQMKRNRSNEWFDEECKEIMKERNAMRAVMLQYGTRQTQLFREKKTSLGGSEI